MDGSTMRRDDVRRPWIGSPWTKAELAASARWFRDQFAEWFIGSWALILGWAIVTTIFFNLLIMDGHFSRGLGEGSGVNPDLFQHVGWMFRCFAALFLVLSVKFESMKMPATAGKVKLLGLFVTCIVVLHATGFGLKALEGKRAQATAVVAAHEATVESYEENIATLYARQDKIRTDLKLAVAPLQARMAQLDKDGEFNEQRTDALQLRVQRLEDAAQDKIDDIDDEVLRLTTGGGEAKVSGAEQIATTEKWAPLFVGLAQFFSWSQNPTDWAIYLSGVLFIIAWVLVADAIVIGVPPALYKLHLRDAQRKQAQDNGSKGGRRAARNAFVKRIKDMRDEEKKRTKADLEEDVTEEDEDDGDSASPKQAAE
jgi:hypothetical protein